MIRKMIIVVLTLGAMGTVTIDIVSRTRPLTYRCDQIVVPTFWKLSIAQAERGKLRIEFETMGDHIRRTPQYSSGFRGHFPPIDARPKPRTPRERLREMGFYATYYALWGHGGGEDDDGNYVYVKALSRYISFGLPAWFLFIVVASYPTLVLIRGLGWRRRYRRTHGLCVACGYDLTGNESGVCPECGSEVESS